MTARLVCAVAALCGATSCTLLPIVEIGNGDPIRQGWHVSARPHHGSGAIYKAAHHFFYFVRYRWIF